VFKLLHLKWKRELEELKQLHDLAMKTKEGELEILRKDLEAEHDRKLREVTSLMRLDGANKEAALKQEYNKTILEMSKEHEEKIINIKHTLMDENYKKLSDAMSKLHEEGNVTTRFTQDLALKMMEGMPKAKVETRVITSGPKE
jgi:transketolase